MTHPMGPSARTALVHRSETPDDVVLELDLPGVDPAELHVSLLDRAVSVRGPGFARELAFPASADVEHLHAALVDGRLELRAPKTRPRRRPIPVHVPYGVACDCFPI